jgi:hypothetical protein
VGDGDDRLDDRGLLKGTALFQRSAGDHGERGKTVLTEEFVVIGRHGLDQDRKDRLRCIEPAESFGEKFELGGRLFVARRDGAGFCEQLGECGGDVGVLGQLLTLGAESCIGIEHLGQAERTAPADVRVLAADIINLLPPVELAGGELSEQEIDADDPGHDQGRDQEQLDDESRRGGLDRREILGQTCGASFRRRRGIKLWTLIGLEIAHRDRELSRGREASGGGETMNRAAVRGNPATS